MLGKAKYYESIHTYLFDMFVYDFFVYVLFRTRNKAQNMNVQF